MVITRRINPIGIDKPIDSIQSAIERNTMLSSFDFKLHDRAYRNKKCDYYVPECEIGNGEYLDVLMDDSFSVTAFFVDQNNREAIDFDFFKTELSLIVQISNLDNLVPNAAHRQDEEMINLFCLAIQNSRHRLTIKSVEKGYKNVYREFSLANEKFEDIGRFFVFRINMETNISIEKKCIN